MTWKLVNILAIIIAITGTYLMYHFGPKENSQTFLYRREEMEEVSKKDQFKNKMVRTGMLLLFISFLLQLVVIIFS